MHTQGPVPLGDQDYAERAFELQTVREVQAGKWVLLLGPRQHGKTSAFLRIRKLLSQHATTTLLIDLQRAPPFSNYIQLVTWFGTQVATALGKTPQFSETNDLSTVLKATLPSGNGPIVILIDEASNLSNDDWRNSFYGQLRAIANDRASSDEGDISRRLRFVFAGTFRPERLVAEANSPFNTCERIETTDLTFDDVKELAVSAGLTNPELAAEAIYDAVGGQPFLNQKLILDAVGSDNELEAISRSLDMQREGEGDHITNLFSKVISDARLVSLVSSLVEKGKVDVEAGNEDQRYLIVLGLLRRERGVLYFRNKIYREVAHLSPQFTQFSVGRAQRAVLFTLGLNAFSQVASIELKDIAYRSQLGAVAAYQAESNRLALAGFGTAMEAVLVDFLQRRVATDLKIASDLAKTKSKYFSATDPTTWNLADLMRGTRGLLTKENLDIPENMREWRNLIHPGVAVKKYMSDSDLAPEVAVASSHLSIILRDLP